MIVETLEKALLRESLHRSSQHNMNQASAGYNAKWFRRGGLFAIKWQKQNTYSQNELIDLLRGINIEFNLFECEEKLEQWINQFNK
jgi:hypothetical protein